MSTDNSTVCSGGPTLIFACSGAADVGAISDKAARKMHKDGAGSMFCMAGIGGRVEPIIRKTQSASKILAIDGCELDCVKRNLQEAGFSEFKHIRVTDLGMAKGSSPATEDNIVKVVAKSKEMIAS